MSNNFATPQVGKHPISWHSAAALARRGILLLLSVLAWSTAQAQVVRMDSFPGGGFAWSRTWIDVTGDGRDDYCELGGTGTSVLLCHYASNGTFEGPHQFGNIGSSTDPLSIRWADVDGNGIPDLCRISGAASDTFGGGGTPGSLRCWFAPGFTSATTSLTIPFYGSVEGPEGTPGPVVWGLVSLKDAFVSDVDADGRADFCYVHKRETNMDLRCHLYQSDGFSSTPNWTWESTNVGSDEWPRGFHDFDGDGYADFCRVISNGTLRCTLGGSAGFTRQISSEAIALPYKEGAAFVDFNGDGKTDFCRIVNSGTSYYRLSCRLSTGVGWDIVERQSPDMALTAMGHYLNRWWVDINSDGLPDFCRLIQTSTGWDLSCRLGRGDTDGNSPGYAFGFTDVVQKNITIGEGDGGRSFCDATGAGVVSYCRVVKTTTSGEQVCWENTWNGMRQCYTPTTNSVALVAGVFEPTENSFDAQARPPLLTAYSDGLGAETRITYLPLSHPEVYSRSGFGTYPSAVIQQPRSPVVYETRAWRTDGTDALTGIARYFFKDLRSDAKTGSRGFAERWIFTEGSNTLDHVVFHQGLTSSGTPTTYDRAEVGLVKYQERFAVASGVVPTPAVVANSSPRREWMKTIQGKAIQKATIQPIAPTEASPFLLLQATTNTLKTLSNAQTKNRAYRYIGTSEAVSYDWNGTSPVAMPTVKTETTLVGHGNVGSLVQTTTAPNGRTWTKTTTNLYGVEDEANWLLGRLTKATVVHNGPTSDQQIADNGARSAGASAGASAMSSTLPAAPRPVSPAVMSTILQLLLEE